MWQHSENELDELENDEGAGALVRAGVALLKQDVPSAGVRVIMTSCFFGGASEEHEEHDAANLGREKAVGKAIGKAIV